MGLPERKKPGIKMAENIPEEEKSLDMERFGRERLVFTWCMEKKIYGKLALEYLTPEDFQEGIPRIVAQKVFSQLENNQGTVEPAGIISRFEEASEQSVVSEMFQSNLIRQMDNEQKNVDKAFAEAIRKFVEFGIQQKLNESAKNNDGATMMELMKKKKELNKLEKEIIDKLSSEKA